MDRPLALGASGSVRVNTKIQFAASPEVCQTFCPLITHSSPSMLPRVRSPNRSLPASGSEKPWANGTPR